ncbi:MAG: class I tRNA ligase family protein, partial [Chloroflexota bacterium]
LREDDEVLLDTIKMGFDAIAERFEKVQLRSALNETMVLAAEVNRYLDTNAPWFEIKTDKAQAAKSVYTAMQAIDWLKLLFSPILPHTSQKLHEFLGYEKPIFGTQHVKTVADELGGHSVLSYDAAGSLSISGDGIWKPARLEPGKPFNKSQPLFKKLEHEIVAAERARLGK